MESTKLSLTLAIARVLYWSAFNLRKFNEWQWLMYSGYHLEYAVEMVILNHM